VLSADSIPSREEWVKAIRKVIFKAQNMGDSVKVKLAADVAGYLLTSSFSDCDTLFRYSRCRAFDCDGF
jgi:hypothetical protein